MQTAPTFEEPLLPPMMSLLNHDNWTTVTRLYEEGDYLATFYATLDYIQADLSQKALNPEKTKYTFPHGSIIVNLEITENHLYISAPFLSVPDKFLIPLMRQVAELNFGTLVLTQIKLEGNDIYFKCNMPLELCEPFKLYRIIEEICIQADANDDVFIEKFGATRFVPMQVEPFTAEQIDWAYQNFVKCLEEFIAYDDYFQSKRMDTFGWDAFYLAFTKIDYMMRPQGFLKSEIEKGVKDLNANQPFNEKILKARKHAEKLLVMPKEKFAESMYKAKQFISEKPTYDLTGLQSYLERSYNNSKDEINKKDYIGATLTLLTGFYGLLYYYLIPTVQYQLIKEALQAASGLEWETASKMLWEACNSIMKYDEKTQQSNT